MRGRITKMSTTLISLKILTKRVDLGRIMRRKGMTKER